MKRGAIAAGLVIVAAAAGYAGWRVINYPTTSAECLDIVSRLYFEGTTRPALNAPERDGLNAQWQRCRDQRIVDTAELQAWQAANVPGEN